MKKINILIILLFTLQNINSQITYVIKNVSINGVSIPNDSPINFGNNTSIIVKFTEEFTKPNDLTIGDVSHIVGTETNGGFVSLITTEFFTLGINNTGFTAVWEKTLYASDYSYSGGNYLAGKLSQIISGGGTPPAQWESNHVIINRTPVFTISPTSINYISCGNTAPRTFSVNNSSSSSGTSITYNWNVGTGWIGSVSSSSNSITLTPASATILPTNVWVNPVFNGILQPTLTFLVSRSPFTSTAAITGPTGLCAGSANYSISNIGAGETITWSLSNPSIGALSNQSNTGATVSFSGNGAQTLKATITNPCGQTLIKTYLLNSGTTTFSSNANITGNTTNICITSGSSVFNLNNTSIGQSVAWSLSNTDIATFSPNGAQVTVTPSGYGSGQQTLKAIITNSCGQTATKTVTFYIGAPTFNKFTYACTTQSLSPADSGSNYSFTPAILNTKHKVIANFSGLTASEASINTNWQWIELPGNDGNLLLISGSKNSRDIYAIGVGTTTLQVRAQNNACSWSEWVDLPITIMQLPSILNRPSQPLNTISLKANNPDTNPTPQYAWNNENIWIRNTQDGIMENQNPVYSPTTPNYIYVKVANSGCNALPSYSLKTYWAKAATSLNWPQSWNDATYNSTTTALGGQIGEVSIPELAPEQEIILSMPFIVPDPAKYDEIFPEPWRFSLLARAVSQSEEMVNPETNDLVQNVVNNDNIAWKNVTMVDCVADNPEMQSIGGVIAVGNTFDTPKSFYLELIKEDLETGKPIYEEAEVSLKLDDVLYQAWVRGGKTSERLDNTLEEKIKLIKDNNVFLKDLELNANETGTLYLKFNFLTKEITDKSKYVYHVIQRETGTNKIIGGETYIIKKQARPLFTADAGGTKYVDKNEPITISAAQINEQAIYNWYDSEGNLVFTGKDLSISTDVAQKFKLEVITADGFKDYTDVDVKLKPNTLGTISPNPVVDNVTIAYKLNEVSSAYLMIVGSYGTTGTSSNYILDLNSSETNIDLSNYSNGLYTVALVCNGQIVDAKNLLKQ